jgi:hypothetical protein
VAPVLVTSFVALTALSPRQERLGSVGAIATNNPLSDMSRSQKYAAYLTASLHSEQNALLRETLEWTFSRPSNAMASSLPPMATNHTLY